ncbi:MAG: hypothetical protein NZ954_01140 [Thermofilaceae archaeon]|nr:hypothetical protein [Thermofilaceae archaeon]MCX8180525.1 hypothetical protein [Thermofilaceae archaeon]MDW8003279.1 signal recognition particle subunit SRP19/SEC65 family protein [Thermofilaceae archaeon]
MSEERRPIVLWPVYFEAGKSRSKGRRVPVHLAVKGMTAEELLKAARAAGFQADLDSKAKHPSHWFESSGRVLVFTREKKSTVVRKVAVQLKSMKAERATR